MIRLDISTAVSAYLLFSVVLVLSLWAFTGRREKDRLKVDDAFIWQCYICTLTYIDSRHDNISRCPRCGSLNKRKEGGKILE